MIHFLISHSISLYCQTEREGMQGTDGDVREREFWWRGKQADREREKWMTENEIKQKERGSSASQATHCLAIKSSAVGTGHCKSSLVFLQDFVRLWLWSLAFLGGLKSHSLGSKRAFLTWLQWQHDWEGDAAIHLQIVFLINQLISHSKKYSKIVKNALKVFNHQWFKTQTSLFAQN